MYVKYSPWLWDQVGNPALNIEAPDVSLGLTHTLTQRQTKLSLSLPLPLFVSLNFLCWFSVPRVSDSSGFCLSLPLYLICYPCSTFFALNTTLLNSPHWPRVVILPQPPECWGYMSALLYGLQWFDPRVVCLTDVSLSLRRVQTPLWPVELLHSVSSAAAGPFCS